MQQKTLGDVLIQCAAFGSSMAPARRRRAYLLALLAALAVIWAPVAAVVLLKPATYTSAWTLVLPVTGSGHAVQLESIGQASSPTFSPFSNSVVDPRVNYKSIAVSEPVIAAAAAAAGLSAAEFGKPRIKLVDQTALMHFRIHGDNAAQARSKARAHQQALETELQRLRTDELTRREAMAAEALGTFSDKLSATQRQIVAFQGQAEIISLDQYRELTMSLERGRTGLEQLRARRAGLAARINELEDGLGVPRGSAGQVLALQNDALFRELLDEASAAAATFSDYSARWGENHFKVAVARESANGLQRALMARARQAVDSTLPAEQLARLANSGMTQALLEELVTLRGELRSIEAEIRTLEDDITRQRLRIDAGAEDAVALEDLQRRQQVAMAVFTTALAKLDLGKTDIFASYPMIQTLLSPTLPDGPDTLAQILALAGGAVGSLFICLALSVLWIRKPYLQKIFQNA